MARIAAVVETASGNHEVSLRRLRTGAGKIRDISLRLQLAGTILFARERSNGGKGVLGIFGCPQGTARAETFQAPHHEIFAVTLFYNDTA